MNELFGMGIGWDHLALGGPVAIVAVVIIVKFLAHLRDQQTTTTNFLEHRDKQFSTTVGTIVADCHAAQGKATDAMIESTRVSAQMVEVSRHTVDVLDRVDRTLDRIEARGQG